MTVQKMVDLCRFTVFARGNVNASITGCYVGDVLSLAMTRLEPGKTWLTVQSNMNVAAIAALTEASCVILAEGRTPDTEMLCRASERGITVLGTERSLYQTACQLYILGVGEEN